MSCVVEQYQLSSLLGSLTSCINVLKKTKYIFEFSLLLTHAQQTIHKLQQQIELIRLDKNTISTQKKKRRVEAMKQKSKTLSSVLVKKAALKLPLILTPSPPKNQANEEEVQALTARLEDIFVKKKTKKSLLVNSAVRKTLLLEASSSSFQTPTVLESVFRFHSFHELIGFELVSQKWKQFLTTSTIWKTAYLQRGWSLGSADHAAISPDGSKTAWKERIRLRLRTEKNWVRGSCNPHVLIHPGVKSVQFNGSTLATGGSDKKIRIWNMEKFVTQSILTGHLGSIHTLQLFHGNKFIISGSSDRTLRLSNIHTSLSQSFDSTHSHTDTINTTCLLKKTESSSGGTNYVVSGSSDRTVKQWDVTTAQCVQTLGGHAGEVWGVTANESAKSSLIASVSQDRSLKLWDLTSGQCIKTIGEHQEGVSTVKWSLDGSKLVTGSRDRTIRIWDCQSFRCLKTFQGHTDTITSLSIIDGNRLVSGSRDSTLRVWDLNQLTSSKAKTLFKQNWGVLSLHADPFKMVSGDLGGQVMIWNFGSPDDAVRIWYAPPPN